MNRFTPAVRIALASTALAGAVALGRTEPPPRAEQFADEFDRGLCVGFCTGARWAIAQQENGRVSASPAPGRSGLALHAQAGPKQDGRVAKADLVARVAPVPVGGTITVAFDLRVAATTPLNSLQLLDLECATCAEGGNPGVRLYLRRGRLRIDRSKIGIQHAWVNDEAPVLRSDRWHRVVLRLRVDTGDNGGVQVTLDGREVLAARGATVLPGRPAHVDRVQIGITANSNPVPAEAWIDRVAVAISR